MLSISRFAPIAEAIAAAADAQLAAAPDARSVSVALDGDHSAEMERQYRAAPTRAETLLRYVIEEWAEPHAEVTRFALRFGTVTLYLR